MEDLWGQGKTEFLGLTQKAYTKSELIKTTSPIKPIKAANGLYRKKPRQVSLLECQPSRMAV